MERLCITAFLALCVVWTVHGLRCWECENARNEKECRRDGRSRQCQAGQRMSCQTEVRHHGGWGKDARITKRCKQTLACDNNQLQNPRAAWLPSQCSPNLQNSVCRCCCDTNNCNRDNQWCIKGTAQCESIPAPQNGVKRCKFTDTDNEIGSVCGFRCNRGFRLRGSRSSTCIPNSDRSGGTFDRQPPKCVLRRSDRPKSTKVPTHTEPPRPTSGKLNEICDFPPAPPATGGRSCVSSKEGTVCTYFCGESESLSGSSVLTCYYRGFSSGWDGNAPTCIPKCPYFPTNPTDGQVSCFGDGSVGTACEFSCNDGYDLIGASTTTCLLDVDVAVWEPASPTCKKLSCPEISSMPRGEMSCTNGTDVGSVCIFGCTDEGYVLQPPGRTSITCTSEAVWSESRPCCSSQCPPLAPMDVVIVLDSSSSVGARGWRVMKAFVDDVISSFTVSNASAHFAIFRFNGRVDEESQILFSDYPEDRQGLLEALAKMPYDGRGTLIGQALNHTKNVMLKHGNREGIHDMVWVMTDGVSFDDVHEVSQEIRNEGAEIFAMGISRPNRRLDKRELLSMGGDEDHVLMADEGLSSLTEELVGSVTTRICTSTCE